MLRRSARRAASSHVCSGVLREDGSVTLYAGAPDDLVSMIITQQTRSDPLAKLRHR